MKGSSRAADSSGPDSGTTRVGHDCEEGLPTHSSSYDSIPESDGSQEGGVQSEADSALKRASDALKKVCQTKTVLIILVSAGVVLGWTLGYFAPLFLSLIALVSMAVAITFYLFFRFWSHGILDVDGQSIIVDEETPLISSQEEEPIARKLDFEKNGREAPIMTNVANEEKSTPPRKSSKKVSFSTKVFEGISSSKRVLFSKASQTPMSSLERVKRIVDSSSGRRSPGRLSRTRASRSLTKKTESSKIPDTIQEESFPHESSPVQTDDLETLFRESASEMQASSKTANANKEIVVTMDTSGAISSDEETVPSSNVGTPQTSVVADITSMIEVDHSPLNISLDEDEAAALLEKILQEEDDDDTVRRSGSAEENIVKDDSPLEKKASMKEDIKMPPIDETAEPHKGKPVTISNREIELDALDYSSTTEDSEMSPLDHKYIFTGSIFSSSRSMGSRDEKGSVATAPTTSLTSMSSSSWRSSSLHSSSRTGSLSSGFVPPPSALSLSEAVVRKSRPVSRSKDTSSPSSSSHSKKGPPKSALSLARSAAVKLHAKSILDQQEGEVPDVD